MTTSPAVLGALLGLVAGSAACYCASRLLTLNRLSLEDRVLPYLRDLAPQVGAGAPVHGTRGHGNPLQAALARVAGGIERILGGATSVHRRLDRAGLDRTVHEFRVEQVMWGLVGFGVAGGFGVVRMAAGSAGVAPLALFCLLGFSVGVIARDHQLSRQVQAREQRMLREFPVVAELLALAVAAGEGPVGALDRVTRRTGGELAAELGRVLGEIRTGTSLQDAFDALAARSGLAVVTRFAQGVSVAVERGTPLAEVLHAQAADVREAGRRALIEGAAKREITMLVPVVFLVLPVTVFFAFWPGVVGLSLTAP